MSGEAAASATGVADNMQNNTDGDDSGVDESTQGKEPTTNGELASPKKSPSKIPSPKKLAILSPTKTPNKRLPKTPEEPPSTGEKKKISMNKIQVGAVPSPNLKTVRSKIGSLENTSYKPGGGKVKIESRKLDFSKAQPRIAAKNDTYVPGGGDKKIQQVKLTWNAKPKVGSLENATHKPGGGAKKIETVRLDFKDKAKPKIGSKDNIKHSPGGGSVKIEDQKLEIKAHSKIGSLDNVKHKPGGGEKKIFDDKEYLRQMATGGALSKESSDGQASGTQTEDNSPSAPEAQRLEAHNQGNKVSLKESEYRSTIAVAPDGKYVADEDSINSNTNIKNVQASSKEQCGISENRKDIIKIQHGSEDKTELVKEKTFVHEKECRELGVNEKETINRGDLEKSIEAGKCNKKNGVLIGKQNSKIETKENGDLKAGVPCDITIEEKHSIKENEKGNRSRESDKQCDKISSNICDLTSLPKKDVTNGRLLDRGIVDEVKKTEFGTYVKKEKPSAIEDAISAKESMSDKKVVLGAIVGSLEEVKDREGMSEVKHEAIKPKVTATNTKQSSSTGLSAEAAMVMNINPPATSHPIENEEHVTIPRFVETKIGLKESPTQQFDTSIIKTLDMVEASVPMLVHEETHVEMGLKDMKGENNGSSKVKDTEQMKE